MAIGTLTTTLAYVDPGPGLSMTWALIALADTGSGMAAGADAEVLSGAEGVPVSDTAR